MHDTYESLGRKVADWSAVMQHQQRQLLRLQRQSHRTYAAWQSAPQNGKNRDYLRGIHRQVVREVENTQRRIELIEWLIYRALGVARTLIATAN